MKNLISLSFEKKEHRQVKSMHHDFDKQDDFELRLAQKFSETKPAGYK